MPFNFAAAASAAAGAVLVWSAVNNQAITVALRDLVRGKKPQPGPAEISSVSGTTPATTDSALANAAIAGIGTPYKWAGSSRSGWDCSGMVNREALEVGLPIPGYPSGSTLPQDVHGPPTGVWFLSPECDTVSETEAQAGDLCCWITHMGVYIGGGKMVSALNPAKGTLETTVEGGSPGPEPFRYRRIKT